MLSGDSDPKQVPGRTALGSVSGAGSRLQVQNIECGLVKSYWHPHCLGRGSALSSN